MGRGLDWNALAYFNPSLIGWDTPARRKHAALVSLNAAPLHPQVHRSETTSEVEREALRHSGPALADPRGLV